MSEDKTVRNPSGSNEPTVTAAEIAEWMDAGEPYVTGDIEEAFDLPNSTAHYRLEKAADEGLVRKHKKGHRTVLWFKND